MMRLGSDNAAFGGVLVYDRLTNTPPMMRLGSDNAAFGGVLVNRSYTSVRNMFSSCRTTSLRSASTATALNSEYLSRMIRRGLRFATSAFFASSAVDALPAGTARCWNHATVTGLTVINQIPARRMTRSTLPGKFNDGFIALLGDKRSEVSIEWDLPDRQGISG